MAGHGVKLTQGVKLAQANLGVGAFREQELGLFEAVIGDRHVQRRLALLVLASAPLPLSHFVISRCPF